MPGVPLSSLQGSPQHAPRKLSRLQVPTELCPAGNVLARSKELPSGVWLAESEVWQRLEEGKCEFSSRARLQGPQVLSSCIQEVLPAL